MAEVSNIEKTYRRGWLLWVTDGRAKPLMDRQVVEVSSLSLSFFLFLWLSTYLPTYLPTNQSIYLILSYLILSNLSIYPSLYLSLSIYLSISLSIYLSIHPSIYLSIHPSIYLSVYLHAWKRSNSARLPQFSQLATSKTKQFCETSFNFWSWQHQKLSNPARLPLKMESWVQPRTNAFCDFSIPSV